MKARCPKSWVHNKFLTTAHVVQTWAVDDEGNFENEISTDETVAGPNMENEWTCKECGSVAIFE